MAMARQSQASPQSFKFRRASFEMLTDCLANLNEKNKDNLRSLSTSSGIFKEKIIFEYTLQICQELRLDPPTAYHAVELLQKFMVKHITNLLTPAGASRVETSAREDAAFEQLQGKFVLIVFSCVQLASKLSLHSQIIDINMGVRFLRSVGLDFSKQAVLESELMVLKGLEFRLDPPNPLTYVEILLEVLGHNEPSAPVERLHHLCCHLLQFVSLQRRTLYNALLAVTTESRNPTAEQREKFMAVTEDCMLLGVGVIAAAAFILHVKDWEQVVKELSHITGISTTSISDFARVTLVLVVETPANGQ
ncbi:cyclin N-terminal domain-containing protein 1 isoform X2 [Syngnathoides biaculeatus]|uniref:cyclin N-terminal domain-containing protein 1 isoform X2 n=1 Tax=Syngnathoides biaculeatus TaxID=300417 RepID=UPI002ADD31F3|nr:cyclin N-terminal domain-containing protein 1 isoform X2 [Syngnathoides biaculeatus]